jgi:hypothetical protein
MGKWGDGGIGEMGEWGNLTKTLKPQNPNTQHPAPTRNFLTQTLSSYQ